MKPLKKLLAVLLALTVFVGLMAGCSGGGNTDDTQSGNVNATGGDANATDGASNEIPVGQTGIGATGVGNYGGHLNMRICQTPTGLDPLKQTGQWKYMFTTCVFENALTRDADNNIAPGVCNFELSEDLMDLKLWVREGITFSNGDPVDIYDVEASLNRSLKLYANIKKYVQPYLESMTVENDGEKDILHIVFNGYHEKILYYWANYRTWAAIMPKEICEKYAGGFIVDQIEDAIGTGPYKYTDFIDSEMITVVKRDDYIPVEGAGTGFANTKYGYMDSISFWAGANDATAAMALLSGEYDMIEVMASDYQEMAKQQGINLEVLPSDTATFIYFNSKGETNLCSMYPSLRKAILAAIDYPSFLDMLTDGSAVKDLTSAENNYVLQDKYATDAFVTPDYYGEAKEEVVNKYLADAKAEGYRDEPVQIVYSNTRTDIPTMMCDALDNFKINYKLTTMETTTYNAFIGSYSNNWDFYFGWGTSNYTPGTLPDAQNYTAFDDARRDEILEKMWTLDPDSDEYMQLWYEMAKIIADNAYVGYMARIEWWWWHPETLHSNDEGLVRYVYNTYWDDPENHPAPDNIKLS